MKAEKPMRIPPVRVVKPGLRVRNAVGRLHTGMLPPTAVALERMLVCLEAKALGVAAELAIADHLRPAPLSIDDLAKTCGAKPDALGRLLDLLAARGFFRRLPDGRFANNRLSAVLRADHPDSVRDWVRFVGSDWNWSIVNQLEAAVRGESAPRAAKGVEFFDFLEANDAARTTFAGAMRDLSAFQGRVIVAGYDFAGVGKLCDVGGGTGTMAASILAAHPRMTGIVFDLPSLEAEAKANLERMGVADRCTFAGGDFFASVPEGCDAYLLQAVVHDWDDDRAAAILANCRKAMAPGGRILVVENMIGGGNDPTVRAIDVLMLILADGGRERSRQDFDRVFAKAGQRVRRDVTLASLLHVFELVPA